jgi:hypothetical protein
MIRPEICRKDKGVQAKKPVEQEDFTDRVRTRMNRAKYYDFQ